MLCKAPRMTFKFNLSCRKPWLSCLVSLAVGFFCASAWSQNTAQPAASTVKKTTSVANQPKAKKTTSNAKNTKKKVVASGTPQGSRSVAEAANTPTGKATNNNFKATTVKPSNAPRARNSAAAATGVAAGVGAVASAGVSTSTGGISAVRSNVVLVQDLGSNTVLFARNDGPPRPIASITKLMTAIVIVDANQAMSEIIEVTASDIDTVKHSRSRLPVGT